MMYDFGVGSAWMMLMPVVWLVLIGVVIWAVVWLARDRRDGGSRYETRADRETPLEILDRRYAMGEVDTEDYLRARDHLVSNK
ncbi:hypothetical protein [Haloechinothrix salitolerans]|uniref:SHOCT domain-containing protein n=1 Tax=Haloechinothrix salitolerans TaxID=926830 RepID=A0ABW2C833_9PSEU